MFRTEVVAAPLPPVTVGMVRGPGQNDKLGVVKVGGVAVREGKVVFTQPAPKLNRSVCCDSEVASASAKLLD